MLSEKQTKTDLGKIKIHSRAISSIAAIATMNVPGVVRIYKGWREQVSEFFGRDPNSNGIKINLKENNEIDIAVAVVVEYGQDVPRIANNVQENIKQAVENMTSLIPVNVDVKVKDIEKTKR